MVRDERFDVVGVGALNLDYLAAWSGPRDPVEAVVGAPVGWGSEAAVAEDVVRGLVGLIDPAEVTVSAGGSTFNLVYALAHARPDLALGYVGVAGTPPTGGISAMDALVRVGVDVTVVGRSPRLPGMCLALGHDGDRTLFTHVGANDETAQYLEERFDELAGYLARARIVHVTSFLDPETPAVLLRLLTAVRRVRPDLVLTLDPGHVWCADPTPEIRGLVALADYLLLNRAELGLLAGLMGLMGPTGDEETRARVVLGAMARDRPVVLVKFPAGVTVYGAAGVQRVEHKTLAPDEIVDSTGAGDVFAAGLLALLVAGSPGPHEVERGARLGLALARHKLRHRGSRGHGEFASRARRFGR
jgi:sugar/nucleoside kinase (ribokinase family)